MPRAGSISLGQVFSVQYFNMKGRIEVSKNCQAGGSSVYKRFIDDFCGCVDDWFAAE